MKIKPNAPLFRDPVFVWEYRYRRSSLQVAELEMVNDELVCNRDRVEIDLS